MFYTLKEVQVYSQNSLQAPLHQSQALPLIPYRSIHKNQIQQELQSRKKIDPTNQIENVEQKSWYTVRWIDEHQFTHTESIWIVHDHY